MKYVNLLNIPSQRFVLPTSDSNYEFAIRERSGSYYYDVVRDNKELIIGNRLYNFNLLLPYPYLERNGVNFLLLNPDNDGYDYKQFNVSQIFIVLDASETLEFRKLGHYKKSDIPDRYTDRK